jgi:uncharacterized protein YutE (UPF0331/DUF86 family)
VFDDRGVADHLRELRRAIRDWERYQSISLEELKRDGDKRNMVSHAMLVGIQAAIDIANHLIAEKGLSKPSTYRESFEILSREGIIPSELAGPLMDLAGFRNLLVHLYWKLDVEKLHGILMSDLKSLREFERIVAENLKQTSGKS